MLKSELDWHEMRVSHAMIAIVGHLKYLNKEYANQTVMATARLKL